MDRQKGFEIFSLFALLFLGVAHGDVVPDASVIPDNPVVVPAAAAQGPAVSSVPVAPVVNPNPLTGTTTEHKSPDGSILTITRFQGDLPPNMYPQFNGANLFRQHWAQSQLIHESINRQINYQQSLIQNQIQSQLRTAFPFLSSYYSSTPTVNYLSHFNSFYPNPTRRLFDFGYYDNANSPNEQLSKEAIEKLRSQIRSQLSKYRAQVEAVHGLGQDDSFENQESLGAEHEEEVQSSTIPDGIRSRVKRAVLNFDNIPPARRRRNITHQHDTGGIEVVTKLYSLSPQPFDYKRIGDISALKVRNEHYIFSLEEGGDGTETCMYRLGKGLNPTKLSCIRTPGANLIELQEINSNYYILPSEYTETSLDPFDAGSHLYRIDFFKNKLDKVQTIKTEHARSISFWTGPGQDANNVFLGVAPEYVETKNGKSYKVEISVYRWQGEYMDYKFSVPAYNPQAIHHATIYSHDYLAVANYQDDTKSTSVYSEIFKYSYKRSKYISFQKILTIGARDIRTFSFSNGQREEYFLAIANYGHQDESGAVNYYANSHIFKFASERFVPFQNIKTYGAFQILPVKAGKKFFLAIGERSGLRLVQYNGWAFVETYSQKFEEQIDPYSFRLRSFIYNDQPYIIASSLNKNVAGGVYSLEFEQKNKHGELSSELGSWCEKALRTMESVDMPQIAQQIEEAPKITDDEIIFESDLSFENITSVSHLFTKVLNYGSRTFDAQTSKDFAERERRLRELNLDVEELKDKLRHVVLRDENQVINTELTFDEVYYTGPAMETAALVTERLNGIKVSDVLNSLIYLDKDYKFDTVNIDHLTASKIENVQKLNGYSLADYALKSSEITQTFTQKNKFSESVVADLGFEVHGLVARINFQDIDFLLLEGNQTFRGDMRIRDSAAENLVSDVVNGVNLKYYYDEGVTKDGSETITGTKRFNEVYAKDFQSEGKLTGVNISDLYEKAILLKGEKLQTFKAQETVMEDLISPDLTLTSESKLINGKYNVEKDFISISSGEYYLASLELAQDTSIDELFVKRFLNQVKVLDDGSLDLILKHSNTVQLIANKNFNSIALEESSTAEGLIDGVDLKGWSNVKEIELREYVSFGKLKTDGYLSVPEGIYVDRKFYQGDHDILKLLSEALLLNSTVFPYQFKTGLIFEDLQVFENAKLNNINKLSPSQWLVNSESNQGFKVTGSKTFKSDISLLQDSTTKELYYSRERNAENVLRIFGDLLVDGIDQTISRSSKFTELLQVDELICPGANFNGVFLKNLLLINGDQEVQGKVIFEKPVRVKEHLSIDGNLQAYFINGYELNEAVADTLRTSGSTPQIFEGSVSLVDGLTSENLELEGKLDGYVLSDLLDNIILDESVDSQIIDGSISFAKSAKLGRLEFSGIINGLGDNEWGNGFLLSRGNQVIHGSTTFKGPLTSDIISVANGKVSEIDIEQLAKSIIRVNQEAYFEEATFQNQVTASQNVDLDVDATVNGFKIHRDLLLQNSRLPQIVTGEKVLKGGMKIDGDLDVKYLSGIDYEQAARFAFGKTSYDDNIVIQGNLKLEEEPSISNSFNGEEWNEILKGIWWQNEDTVLPGSLQFSDIILKNGAVVNGLLSGVDVLELKKEYLSRSYDQVITGYFVFDKGVTFESLNIESLTLGNGKINNVDLQNFRNSVILNGVDQNITIRMYFESMEVREFEGSDGSIINGINLSKDLATLRGENYVTGRKTIENLTIGKLILGEGTLLDGVNLKEWFEQSRTTNGEFTVSGLVNFEKAAFLKNIEVKGKLDGVEISRDTIFTLSGDQNIKGTYTFEQISNSDLPDFIARQGIQVNGLFNGHKLEEAIEKLILQDNFAGGHLVITGEKSLSYESWATSSLIAEELYQGFNISDILSGLRAEAYLTSPYNLSLEDKYSSMNELAEKLLAVSKRRPIFADYFELSFAFDSKYTEGLAFTKALDVFDETMITLIKWTSATTATVTWHTYNAVADDYEESDIKTCSVVGSVTGVAEIHRDEKYYAVITINSVSGLDVTVDVKVEPASSDFELYKSSGKLSKTFVVEVKRGDSNSKLIFAHQILYGYSFNSPISFEIRGSGGSTRSCALTNSIEPKGKSRSIILCFTEAKVGRGDEVMHEFQTLEADNPILASTLTVLDKTYVMIGNSGSSKKPVNGAVDVWVHVAGATGFKKVDCLPVFNIISMDALHALNWNAFLAVASGQLDGTLYYGGVYIYRYSFTLSKFEKVQTISVSRPLQVKFQYISVSKEAFLYILTRQSVLVYTFKGVSGWIFQHELNIESGFFMEIVNINTETIYKSQLIVSGEKSTQVFSVEFNGIESLTTKFIEYSSVRTSFNEIAENFRD